MSHVSYQFQEIEATSQQASKQRKTLQMYPFGYLSHCPNPDFGYL